MANWGINIEIPWLFDALGTSITENEEHLNARLGIGSSLALPSSLVCSSPFPLSIPPFGRLGRSLQEDKRTVEGTYRYISAATIPNTFTEQGKKIAPLLKGEGGPVHT